jgi:hypothetical protein
MFDCPDGDDHADDDDRRRTLMSETICAGQTQKEKKMADEWQLTI